uniref:tumor necrosis factor ligand superfamily member 4 n=1 Tax=Ictidomys tridecemlineatus TaxID=43179 RepID=UPI001A9E36D8
EEEEEEEEERGKEEAAAKCTESHIQQHSLQVQYPSIQSIRIQFNALPFSGCEKKFFRIVPEKAETMKVENSSIIINCDGFYLISLKGYFSQEVNVSLYFRKGHNPISIQSTNKKVNFITVVSLAFKDKVYLDLSAHNTSCLPVNGGELILIHQNPGGFCAP